MLWRSAFLKVNVIIYRLGGQGGKPFPLRTS
jgi:hypothetical protein